MKDPDEKSGDDGRAVWVSIDRKVYLGKYETLSVNVGARRNVDPGETVGKAIKRLSAEVRQEHADLLEAVREDQNL